MRVNEVDARMFNKAWSRIWWLVLVQALVTLGFGIYTLANPAQTPETLVQFLAVFIIVSGLMGILETFLERRTVQNWTRRLLGSLIVILIGVGIFAAAQFIATMTITFLLYLVGFATAVTGIVKLLKGVRQGQWMRAFIGILWLIFAAIIFTQTRATAVVLVWFTGAFLLLLGLFLLFLAFRLRGMRRQMFATTATEIIEGEIIEETVYSSSFAPEEQLPAGTNKDKTQ